ncbi:hypothetical protein, partial [Streptomyces sp. NPDC006446]|uniref:hypothetical protein n=1 Tax=Streptomyces sp. NPDC006446 TaxID=3154301 RepID=UPI0033BC63F3
LPSIRAGGTQVYQFRPEGEFINHLRQPNTRFARFARPRAKSIPPPAVVYEFALRAEFINLRASGTN